MKLKLFIKLVSFLFVLPILVSAQQKHDPRIDAILEKETIRIVITDSGIGGLSVMSDIADKLDKAGSFRKVELIFANALFSAESGYNALQSRQEKIEMFSRALTGMNKKYKPDLIFVACNTLSVLVDDTPFKKKENSPPIISIVDAGVELISRGLKKDSTSSVIIFGTETTIEENTYKTALLDMGFRDSRIVNKACPQLQSYIEQNPSGEETGMLISFYMLEALSELSDMNSPVDISLNCTHFGYSYPLWEKALHESGYKPGEILNPNMLMGDFLLTGFNRDRYNAPSVNLSVVSKVKLLNVESMIRIFEPYSPAMAEAIENYRIIDNLF